MGFGSMAPPPRAAIETLRGAMYVPAQLRVRHGWGKHLGIATTVCTWLWW